MFAVAHDDGAGAAAQGPHGLVHRDLGCLVEDHHVKMHRPGGHKGGQGGRVDHEAGRHRGDFARELLQQGPKGAGAALGIQQAAELGHAAGDPPRPVGAALQQPGRQREAGLVVNALHGGLEFGELVGLNVRPETVELERFDAFLDAGLGNAPQQGGVDVAETNLVAKQLLHQVVEACVLEHLRVGVESGDGA